MSGRLLVYGYGNPGRLDDGLGPALVRELAWAGPGQHVRLESAYQLQVEDAALVAGHDLVVFADACADCPSPFELRPLRPARELRFSTHSVGPAALLALAHEHFGARTRGFVLAVRGYDFEGFGERLSPRAGRNLAAACAFLLRALREGSLASSEAHSEGAADARA